MKSDHAPNTKPDTVDHGAGSDHEVSTLSIGPIVWFMIGLSVAIVIICLLMTGLLDVYANRGRNSEERPSPLAGERQKLPPEPRLQLAPTSARQLEEKLPPNIREDNPLQEMKRLRTQEDAKLNSYGWVDEKAGLAHIPIDEAKKLLLEGRLKTK